MNSAELKAFRSDYEKLSFVLVGQSRLASRKERKKRDSSRWWFKIVTSSSAGNFPRETRKKLLSASDSESFRFHSSQVVSCLKFPVSIVLNSKLHNESSAYHNLLVVVVAAKLSRDCRNGLCPRVQLVFSHFH
jgi:hypothetical protein